MVYLFAKFDKIRITTFLPKRGINNDCMFFSLIYFTSVLTVFDPCLQPDKDRIQK